MHDNKVVKLILFTLAVAGFTVFALWRSLAGDQAASSVSCLGIPVISADDIDAGQTYSQQDYYNQLFFEGQRVALDRETNTIYISQRIDDHTGFQDLQGTLELQNPFCSLSFLSDPMMEDLDTAVSQGHSFTLLISQPFSSYSEYKVIFTTFPVVRMDGSYSHSLEDERKVYHGELVIWDSGRTAEPYTTKATNSYWRIRGGVTADYPKKSWRLSLVDEHRRKKDVSFLGLDADDDWILNPLVLDDTKMREMYNTRLWNTLAEAAPWNPVTSEGQYVEVVKDGAYSGLYLLMRRMDAKYLGIDQQTDILLKGRPEWQAEDDGYLYEVQSSFLSQAESCAEVEKTLSGNGNSINLPNFIDLSLLLQLNYGWDNRSYKNMYYLLSGQENGFMLSWTPWDMDMTFANGRDEDLQDTYDSHLTSHSNRREKSELSSRIPDLDRQLALRWQELRGTVFSVTNLTQLYFNISQELEKSGSIARDRAVWGQICDGTNTPERMLQFINERLAFLDAYYTDILADDTNS